MTVTTTVNRIRYTATPGQTVFPYTFLILAEVDLLVYVNDALQAATQYSVSNVGVGSGGNVTFEVAMAGGEDVLLFRSTDATQQVNLLEGGALPADPTEGMWDRLTLIAQDHAERINRAVKIPRTSDNAGTELFLPDPAMASNQDKALFINGSGELETREILATDVASPITAKGDLIQGANDGSPEKLPVGSDGDVLTVASGKAAWAPPVTGLAETIFDAKGDLIVATAADTAARKAAGDQGAVLVTDQSTADGLAWMLAAALHGRCYLARTSGTLLTLAPQDGHTILVKDSNGWRLRSLAATVTAANTSVYVNGVAGQNLAASTLYLVTLFDDSGTLTIDFRTTLTHAADADTGVEIATGLATRTVVGLIKTNSSSQFQDSEDQRWTRSWFLDGGVAGRKALTADRTVSSTGAYVHINAEARVSLLMWANEFVVATTSGEAFSSTGTDRILTGIGVDSTSSPEVGVTAQEEDGTGDGVNIAVTAVRSDLAQGIHEFNILGRSEGSATNTYEGTTSPRQCTINAWTVRRR